MSNFNVFAVVEFISGMKLLQRWGRFWTQLWDSFALTPQITGGKKRRTFDWL